MPLTTGHSSMPRHRQAAATTTAFFMLAASLHTLLAAAASSSSSSSSSFHPTPAPISPRAAFVPSPSALRPRFVRQAPCKVSILEGFPAEVQSMAMEIKGLIKNYRPLPPADQEIQDFRCALLHMSARKAIKSGKIDVAEKFYKLFLYEWQGSQNEASVAHTYFLWALLEQRRENFLNARKVFSEAVERFPTHGRLWQGWALMESRWNGGSKRLARRLIEKAVERDQSLQPVLKWKMWSSFPDEQGRVLQPQHVMVHPGGGMAAWAGDRQQA